MILIHDIRLPSEYKDALKEQLPTCVFHPLDMSVRSNVYGSILSHPDIYFFRADDRTLVHAPMMPDSLLAVLADNGLDLVKGNSDPAGEYPSTARFNAVRVGETVLCNEKCVDEAVLEDAKRRSLKVVDTTQGYTRCAVLTAGDNAIVTSDEGIAHQAELSGIDTLLITPGHILLPGESYGFIGGVSGRMPDGRVVLLGDLHLHPDGVAIKDFIAGHGTELIELEGLPLYDAGSLMFVDNGFAGSRVKGQGA